jgi:arylsulfatase A-like enzyme
MSPPPNILFVMADQLRWDYLGCTGHPHIKTPHIDALAARGVRFDRTFVQSPVCGGSRMSFYTGRYNISHGATYNNFPLRVDEMTLGDYLRPAGYRTALVGKTHFKADAEGMARLGIGAGTNTGTGAMACGFEEFERDDGLHPDQANRTDLAYNRWLRQLGYAGDNPWHSHANSVIDDDGKVASGWAMRNARKPARVKKEHSETAYTTDRALAFLDQAGDAPWCLHLSYIKPHWPYIAPAPYHAMYGPEHVLAQNASAHERAHPHPVVAAFMQHDESVNFSRPDVRDTVIPTYMGLISEIDDHIGRVVGYLEKRGLADNTVIVVTSDHGDYLGDHWLGEKELFHEESVRIPLIIMDPREGAAATRGSVSDALVQAIDLVPTFTELAGAPLHAARMEGLSLVPLLAGVQPPVPWRDTAFCDSDFAMRPARRTLGLAVNAARGFMARTKRWKYVYFPGFPPQLFDLDADPHEQTDLGTHGGYADVRADMKDRLLHWLMGLKTRTTIGYEAIERLTGTDKARGFRYGEW